MNTTEDPRKTALKNGLRQLSYSQLLDVQDYQADLCLDDFNYDSGTWCPLAVGLGLHQWVRNPTSDTVHAIMALGGLKVFNTRGVKGEFYTLDRKTDLRIALNEVLHEKWMEGHSATS
jgi:hypothetical protein